MQQANLSSSSPHDGVIHPARWWILTLLFFATTINYLDRIVFSVLIPVIRKEFQLSDQDYGYINAAFQITYTVGFLFMGRLIDRRGTRFGYALSIAWWSAAAGLHAFAQGAWSLSFWRAMLGLGESGNFPAAIKSVGEWFPAKDRAFATGIFNGGTNVASIIGPPIFAFIALRYGWRICFLLTAAAGFLWMIAWLLAPRPPVAHADEADGAVVVTWGQALRMRQTWGFGMAKFFSDPVWWFYLYWLPPYFFDVRKMNLQEIGWALPVIYVTADVGSVAGGWFSGWLIRRNWRPGRSRQAGMLFFALCMPVAATSVLVSNPIIAIALISLATAAHQGWSANLFTTVSDIFPRSATASVTGIGGCLGGLGGVLFSALIPGWVVTNFGYTPVFLAMGVFHLIGFGFAKLLLGDGEPADVPMQPARP